MIKILYTSSPVDKINAFPVNGKDASVPKLKEVLMKQVTWLVLFSYTLLMFRPVMPVVMDVLAHTFWEQQHLLTVHEVNGKFHVHNELINVSRQSDKDKQTGGNKYQIEECIPVYGPLVNTFATNTIIKKNIYPSYKCFYPTSSFDLDAPPPKA